MGINYFVDLWKKITVSGLRSGKTPHDRKSILFINRLSMLNTLLMIVFSIVGPILHLNDVLYFTIPFAIAFAIPPYLNKINKLEFCRLYFSIMPLFFLTGVCMHNGQELGDKYFILTTATIPLILFRKRWIINLLFGLNVAVFFFIVWYQSHYPPSQIIPEFIEKEYWVFSSLTVFGIIFFVLQYFRNDSEDYEKELEEKNFIISHKNNEIIDSITYAKRLQEAIMPPLDDIHSGLLEYFILYKPKDIVAGDFYFAEKKGDYFFIAAADCTGHGVPGALVSVVCSNALYRAVSEFELVIPGKILDKVTELVIETFKKSKHDVKDGMDISLCAINFKSGEMCWSGANNPLWYVSPSGGSAGSQQRANLAGEVLLKEIPADKQPIGKHDYQKPFTTHCLPIKKGTILYLFTDGYADQFGGPKGKKFKYKQLEEIISTNSHLPMEEQKQILEKAFFDWKGKVEQVDDVCVIGIKI